MHGLDLFSGIGGLSIALSEWVRPIAYCEIDPYCQGVLLSRMADESLCNAPIWDDIRTFPGLPFNGIVDIIYGGFPCQDISIAGRGKGLAGERSGLFFEIVRLAKEIKPKFIFLENVPAITSRGGLRVVREIAEMGYDCRWCVISAKSVGACHKRERWFLLAYSNLANSKSSECSGLPGRKKKTFSSIRNYSEYSTINEWQKIVSEMGKCTDGVQFHAHRLRALGNAVVPQQAKKAFKILMGLND